MAAAARSTLLARIKSLKLDNEQQKETETPTSDEDTLVQISLPAMLKELNLRKRQRLKGPTASGDVPRLETDSDRLQEYFQTSDLERKIIRQVEYYFGDHNLPRDRYMLDVMDNNSGWIPMETMLTFKRLADLSKDADQIMMALDKSVNKVVQVDFERRQIRRHPDNPLPDMDEAKRLEIQERTLFVGGFDRKKTTLDHLLELFEGTSEQVCNVRMRYHHQTMKVDQNDNQEEEERQFLGSVFVTFGTLQDAHRFLGLTKKAEGLTFKGRKLTAKFQRQFLDQRVQDNDEFIPEKVGRTLFIQGFDNLETEDEELANFFSMFEDAETVRKRVYRDHTSKDENEGQWRFTGTVFVCFETEEAARKFFHLHQRQPLSYRGDKLNLKWQADFFERHGKFRKELAQWKDSM